MNGPDNNHEDNLGTHNQANVDKEGNKNGKQNFHNQAGSGAFPFDIANWEDAPDLNFLLDPQNTQIESPSIISNVLSPMNTFNNQNQSQNNHNNLNNNSNQNHTFQGNNTPNRPATASGANTSTYLNSQTGVSSAGTPVMNTGATTKDSNTIDYSAQLQHYQNLLLETQNLLTMKQMQQKLPNQGNIQNQTQTQNYNSNQNQQTDDGKRQQQQQQQQQQQYRSQNQQRTLLQQQILQLSQAQMTNNKLINPQLTTNAGPSSSNMNVISPASINQAFVQGMSNLGEMQPDSLALQPYLNNSLKNNLQNQGLPSSPSIPGSGGNAANMNRMMDINPGEIQQMIGAMKNNINYNMNSMPGASSPQTTNFINSNSNINMNINPNMDPNINMVTKYNNNSNMNLSIGMNPNALVQGKRVEPPQPKTKIRPCDHCRRRKIKCVLIPDTHSCKTCQMKNIKCTFNETASLKRNIGSPDSSDGKRMKFEDPTIEPPPNIAVRNTAPIKDYATMQGHSLLKKTLSLQFPRSSFYVGPTSIYDPLFLDKVTLDKIDQFQVSKTKSIRKVAKSVQFLLRDDFSELLYERAEKDSDIVEKYVAPHGQTLIDLYFRTIHPSFPVLHKKIFLEKYSRTHREFGAPLLAAVYLLAIQWWDYEPKLAKFPKPDVLSLHRFAMRTFGDITQRPKLSAVQAGLLLLQCQTISQFNIINSSWNSTDSVEDDSNSEKTKNDSSKKSKKEKDARKEKAREMETQLQISNQNNWLLCTQVVGLAEELGLGLDCSSWRLPKWERGLRRRLAWAVYVQDKWSSLVEAKPSHINDSVNWVVKPLVDEDFPEKNTNSGVNTEEESYFDIELGKESFKHTVSLSIILSDILNALYTPRAMESITFVDDILRIAKPLQLQLRQWYHSLPKSLQMGSPAQKHFSVNGNLQLSYFATEITLHRRIISVLYNQEIAARDGKLVGQRSPGTPSIGSTPSAMSNLQPVQPPSSQLVAVCRNAARTRLTAAITFIRELNTEHMRSFWHSSAPRNFALVGIFATLLYVTSSDADEASVYRECLMDYRWILKVNSTSFGIAKEALSLIDGVVKNIPGLWTEYDGVSINHVSGVSGPVSGNSKNNNDAERDEKIDLTGAGKLDRCKDAVTPNANVSSSATFSMKANTNISAPYNFDISNGVSPRTIVSPKHASSPSMLSQNYVAKNSKRVNDKNSPVNSSHPSSPLNTMSGNNTDTNVSSGKNSKHISRTNTTSPLLMMKSKRNFQYNGTMQEKIDSNQDDNAIAKTPTTNAPTPTLMSQTQASSPALSHTSQGHSRGASQSYRNGVTIKKEQVSEGKPSQSNTPTEEVSVPEANSISAKQKAENLFKYDNQQSLMNMATALGITAEDENRLLNTLSRSNTSDSKEQSNV